MNKPFHSCISYCSGRRKRSRKSQNPLIEFVEVLCLELRENGQRATAKAYRIAVNRLVTFTGNKNILIEDITPELMRRYDRYLLDRGKKPNTVSCYIRSLRAIYNRAIRKGLMSQPESNPFADVHTGIYETEKRAMSVDEIGQLSELSVTANERKLPLFLRCALLYFLFCLHARGMSFADLAYLKKCDVIDGHIAYFRRKTKRKMTVYITSPMQQIIEYFDGTVKDSEYLFPIIDQKKGDEYRQYQTALTLQNRRLKTLGTMAGIFRVITTHVARHTWATLAKKSNVPIAMISECLGHRSVKTTEIYMGSFDRPTLEKVSRWISAVIFRAMQDRRNGSSAKSLKTGEMSLL